MALAPENTGRSWRSSPSRSSFRFHCARACCGRYMLLARLPGTSTSSRTSWNGSSVRTSTRPHSSPFVAASTRVACPRQRPFGACTASSNCTTGSTTSSSHPSPPHFSGEPIWRGRSRDGAGHTAPKCVPGCTRSVTSRHSVRCRHIATSTPTTCGRRSSTRARDSTVPESLIH